MWQPSASDPNLEAAFLTRFMQYLGVDGRQAENALAKKPTLPAANEMARIEGKSLIVFGDYGRNWRRTGLALDRIGLTVVGQNTERHAFLVQKAPNESNAVTEQKPGLFKRLLGKGKAEKPAEQPELIVYAEPVADGSRIVLLNKDGKRICRQRRIRTVRQTPFRTALNRSKQKQLPKQKLLFCAELFTTNGGKISSTRLNQRIRPKADRTHNAPPGPPSIPLRERLSTAPTHSA
nr:outer membrane protein assembly factor BamC [Neisseria gonorrhoeae]